MDRFPAVKRPGGTKVDGKQVDVYDCRSVWPTGRVFNGVQFDSWVKVVRVTEGDPVKVRVWMPGADPVDVDVPWVTGWSAPCGAFGMVSFAPLVLGVELDAWWELTAGKAA